MPADGLGDLADGHAFVADSVEHRAGGRLLHSQPVKTRGVLRARGADELTARLGAEVGMLAFTIAVERWLESGDDEPFALHAAAALSELQTRAAELDSQVQAAARPMSSGSWKPCEVGYQA